MSWKPRLKIYFDDDFYGHEAYGHPECPERLGAIREALRKSPLWDRLDGRKLRPAERNEIELVHSASHYRNVKKACREAPGMLDPDTYVSQGSWEAALKAAGSVLDAVKKVSAGIVDRVFCLVRPPGHHATRERAMGFCLFNNIAIGTRYAVDVLGRERIAILDWDVHHGNGTQEAFYADPRVLYVSLHRYPFFPGTGSSDERGYGEGEGSNLNIPLDAGTTREKYLEQFKGDAIKAIENFQPQLTLISAGFDAHCADPLGGLGLVENDFYEITRILLEATRSCSTGVVSVIEGGYNLDVLGDCVLAHLEALDSVPL